MVGLFLAKEVFEMIKNKSEDNSRLLTDNTLAITELKIRIEELNKRLDGLARREELDKVDEKVEDLTQAIVSMFSAKSGTSQ